MGMYTRLDLNVALISGQDKIVNTVRRMVAGEATELEGRLQWMLKCSSYYHDNIQHASLEYDDISKCFKLSVVCDLKNYESEIETFLRMIAPAVDNCFAGYVRYEEDTVPDLIWFVDGEVLRCTPEIPAALKAKLDSV